MNEEIRAGRLSIVSTPIGNLEDMSPRAVRTLKEADLILAEDTRRTRRLCAHHDIRTRLRPFHAHSTPKTIEQCVRELMEGARLALVSDAGTPLISDPGAELVQAAARNAIAIQIVPGPSAVTAALGAAAIAFGGFRFAGFLPRGGRARQEALRVVAEEREATVLFESPKRIGRTLADLAGLLEPTRPVAVCRELTKLHEEIARGNAAELAQRFCEGTRGEVTLVIGGRTEKAEKPVETDIDQAVGSCLDRGMTARDIVDELWKITGLSRGRLYARVIEIKKKRG